MTNADRVYRVELSEEAVRQAEASARWWAEHRSPEEAARWLDCFLTAVSSLSRHPHARPPAEEDGLFPVELRELHFGLGGRPTHRAVFRVSGRYVTVLTVRHVRQPPLGQGDLPA